MYHYACYFIQLQFEIYAGFTALVLFKWKKIEENECEAVKFKEGKQCSHQILYDGGLIKTDYNI